MQSISDRLGGSLFWALITPVGRVFSRPFPRCPSALQVQGKFLLDSCFCMGTSHICHIHFCAGDNCTCWSTHGSGRCPLWAFGPRHRCPALQQRRGLHWGTRAAPGNRALLPVLAAQLSPISEVAQPEPQAVPVCPSCSLGQEPSAPRLSPPVPGRGATPQRTQQIPFCVFSAHIARKYKHWASILV